MFSGGEKLPRPRPSRVAGAHPHRKDPVNREVPGVPAVAAARRTGGRPPAAVPDGEGQRVLIGRDDSRHERGRALIDELGADGVRP